MANGVSSSVRSHIFRSYRSFGAVVVTIDRKGLCELEKGEFIFFTMRYQQPITKNQQLTITYLTMTISTKTNSNALSYLSIITNKTVEMIAMKIFRFVQVATVTLTRRT